MSGRLPVWNTVAALGALLAATPASAYSPIPQSPTVLAPYLELPQNGAVFVEWETGDAAWLEVFDVRVSRNGIEERASVSEFSGHVISVGVAAMSEGDQLSVRIDGGEVEMPWLTWTVVPPDTEAPVFTSEPSVRGVWRTQGFEDRLPLDSVRIEN